MDHEGLTSCPGCTELIGTTSGNEKIILWPLAVHRFNIVRLIISPSVKQNQYDSVLPSTFGHEVYECPMDYASYLTYHCHIEAYNLCLNSDLSDDNIWLHWNDFNGLKYWRYVFNHYLDIVYGRRLIIDGRNTKRHLIDCYENPNPSSDFLTYNRSNILVWIIGSKCRRKRK